MFWGILYGLSGPQFPGTRRQAWQWQPTLTVHDPNPPITIEVVIAPAAAEDPSRLALMGVGD